jgi:hypothetical protein
MNEDWTVFAQFMDELPNTDLAVCRLDGGNQQCALVAHHIMDHAPLDSPGAPKTFLSQIAVAPLSDLQNSLPRTRILAY